MKRIFIVICFFLIEITGSASFADPGVQKIFVVASRFRFQPSLIVVKRSHPVELHVRSRDVLHGFYIPSLNIRVDLVPNKTVVVKLPALTPGRYPFLCSIFCGTGHSGMHGALEVQ